MCKTATSIAVLEPGMHTCSNVIHVHYGDRCLHYVLRDSDDCSLQRRLGPRMGPPCILSNDSYNSRDLRQTVVFIAFYSVVKQLGTSIHKFGKYTSALIMKN